MKLDKNTQIIFLLTYKFNGQINPLSIYEYNLLTRKVKDAGLEGPYLLLEQEKIVDELGLDSDLKHRIKKLLEQKGAATLYLEKYFNQGFSLLTRDKYPPIIKKTLLENTHPFLSYSGNISLLDDLQTPLIFSIYDLQAAQEKIKGSIIVILDSLSAINQLMALEGYHDNIVIIAQTGLSAVIKFPIIRNFINRKNSLLLSTKPIENRANDNPLSPYLLAFSFSNKSVFISNNKHKVHLHLTDKDFKKHRTIKLHKVEEDETFIYHYLSNDLHIPNDIVSETNENLQYSSRKYETATQNPGWLQENIPISPTVQAVIPPSQKFDTIYTIGHSNKTIERFIELLSNAKVNVLVDLRSNPSSKFVVQFNQDNLIIELEKAGIEYIFLGKELGGRPLDRTVLTSDDKIIRDKIELKDWYQNGIKKLEAIIKAGKITAIMCSEENPQHCHRGYIVGNTLIEKAYTLIHIRDSGSVLQKGLMEAPSDQLELF